MTYSIRRAIDSADLTAYYDLRFRVLRAPLGKADPYEKVPGDDDVFHHYVMYNTENVLVAICSICPVPNEPDTRQIRFVAVDFPFQGQGCGQVLMKECESIIANDNKKQIVLHAREPAVRFYIRLGYTLEYKSYLFLGQVQHYFMSKVPHHISSEDHMQSQFDLFNKLKLESGTPEPTDA